MNLTSIRPGVLAQKISATPAFKGEDEQQDDSSRPSLATKAGIPAALLAAMFGLGGCDNGPDSNTQSIPEGAIPQCNQADDLNTLKSEVGFPFIDQIYTDRQEACNRDGSYTTIPITVTPELKQRILENSAQVIQEIKDFMNEQGYKDVLIVDMGKSNENEGCYNITLIADPKEDSEKNQETTLNTGNVSDNTYNNTMPSTTTSINRPRDNDDHSFRDFIVGMAALGAFKNSSPPQVIYINPNARRNYPEYVPPTPVYRETIVNKIYNPTNSRTRTIAPPPLPRTAERPARPAVPSSSTPAVSVPSSKPVIPGVSTQYKVEPAKPLKIPAQPTPTRPTMQGPSTSFTVPTTKPSAPTVNLSKPSSPSSPTIKGPSTSFTIPASKPPVTLIKPSAPSSSYRPSSSGSSFSRPSGRK